MYGIDRIQQQFQQGQTFVGYLTAGDGGIDRSLDAALALIEGGVNILEIGVPFSDPIADGPVIQRAATRALVHGTTLKDVFWLTQEIRKKSNIPLILFTYLNPVLCRKPDDFFKEISAAGIDGLLLVDCPLEESLDFQQRCLTHHIAPIYVITPSTPLERIKKIEHYARGFLYYACRKGTTGIQSSLPEDFALRMQTIKTSVNLPVVAGFGIASSKDAKQVLEYADGFVVGSLFVKAIEEHASHEALVKLAQSMTHTLR